MFNFYYKIFIKKLSVYSVLGLMFSLCQEAGQDDLNDVAAELMEYDDPDNYESKLTRL